MLKRIQKNSSRINEVIRLITWSHEYNGLWEAITNKDSPYMTPEMMQRLVRFLAKKEMYDLIYVMLSVHKDKKYVIIIYDLMFKDSIINELRRGKKNDVIKRLIKYLN